MKDKTMHTNTSKACRSRIGALHEKIMSDKKQKHEKYQNCIKSVRSAQREYWLSLHEILGLEGFTKLLQVILCQAVILKACRPNRDMDGSFILGGIAGKHGSKNHASRRDTVNSHAYPD